MNCKKVAILPKLCTDFIHFQNQNSKATLCRHRKSFTKPPTYNLSYLPDILGQWRHKTCEWPTMMGLIWGSTQREGAHVWCCLELDSPETYNITKLIKRFLMIFLYTHILVPTPIAIKETTSSSWWLDTETHCQMLGGEKTQIGDLLGSLP